MTKRSRTVSLFKKHAFCSQTINIGGLCLRMPAQTSDPVIEIIDGDEEDVWGWRSFRSKAFPARRGTADQRDRKNANEPSESHDFVIDTADWR
jgi:hypothetical protein